MDVRRYELQQGDTWRRRDYLGADRPTGVQSEEVPGMEQEPGQVTVELPSPAPIPARGSRAGRAHQKLTGRSREL